MILIEDINTIKELIDQAVKVNNQIYQREHINQKSGIPLINKAPQRAPKQYNSLKLMDLSGTREKKKGACRNYSKLGHYTREYKNRPREQRLN